MPIGIVRHLDADIDQLTCLGNVTIERDDALVFADIFGVNNDFFDSQQKIGRSSRVIGYEINYVDQRITTKPRRSVGKRGIIRITHKDRIQS